MFVFFACGGRRSRRPSGCARDALKRRATPRRTQVTTVSGSQRSLTLSEFSRPRAQLSILQDASAAITDRRLSLCSEVIDHLSSFHLPYSLPDSPTQTRLPQHHITMVHPGSTNYALPARTRRPLIPTAAGELLSARAPFDLAFSLAPSYSPV